MEVAEPRFELSGGLTLLPVRSCGARPLPAFRGGDFIRDNVRQTS
jgi:hypothetical protein